MPTRHLTLAVVLCGVLDIGYAIGLNVMRGGTAGGVLRGMASGPFGPQAMEWGAAGALAGLGVHFAIMAAMVAVYFVLVQRGVTAGWSPWLAGALYGVALYLVMFFGVMPARWPTDYPQVEPLPMLISLLPHVVLVGIPLALIAARAVRQGALVPRTVAHPG